MVEQQLYLARKTMIEMLEDRGYVNTNAIRNYAYSHFSNIYSKFNNNSGVFDISASDEDGNKTIVKFVKTINEKTPTFRPIKEGVESISAKKELLELYEFINESMMLDKTDQVVFVICYGDDIHDAHLQFESSYPNVQVFHIKRLVFNISKHSMVPKHELVNKSEVTFLKRKLNIESVLQLPVILKSDPMAKYLNLKQGDVCRIYRPSKSAGTHICYRVCQNS